MSKSRFIVLDNGGDTLDRYSVYVTTRFIDGGLRRYVPYIAMSSWPFHPQGFGQTGELTPAEWRGAKLRLRQIGKRIKLTDLPNEARKCAIQFICDYDNTFKQVFLAMQVYLERNEWDGSNYTQAWDCLSRAGYPRQTDLDACVRHLCGLPMHDRKHTLHVAPAGPIKLQLISKKGLHAS